MSKEYGVPYVPVEIIGGRLVRTCPACDRQVGERTDEAGVVSNDFANHYEAEHGEKEPERQRAYLLGLQPREDRERGPGREALRNVSRLILETVERQIPELDWQLVHGLEGVPPGAPVLQAGQVLRGSWQREGDDPQLWQVRWYGCEQGYLVFSPTRSQLDEWDAESERARDVRAALIERHRDRLPVFSGDSVAAWEEYYGERRKQEDEIAKDFDRQRDVAMRQFYRGDHCWLATLRAAISDLAIPEQEVEELRARRKARLTEVEQLYESTSRR